jgi:hypothetical protein
MISTLGKIPFAFTVIPWQHSGSSGWVLVNVPHKMSNEIRKHFKREEQGWGRLSIIAQIKNTSWPPFQIHQLAHIIVIHFLAVDNI